MKKVLSVVLTMVLLAGLVTPALAIDGPDNGTVKAAREIESMSISAGTCTRGEWIAKLVETLGLVITEDEYPDNYFTDVADDPNYASIMTATKFGLIDVEAGEAFEPGKPLTREFAAHTANFYLGFIPESEAYTFSDSEETAYPADAQIAVARGWFELLDGKFLPQAQVTDGEIEKILADAKKVTEGVQAAGSNSSYTFAEGVKEIEKGTQVEIDGDTVTIYDCPVELQPEDLFAVYIDNIALVYKVVSVDRSQEGVAVVTAGDAPDNSILSVESSGTMSVDLADGFVPSGETTMISLTNGEIMTIGPARIASRANNRINVSRSVKVGDAIKGSISADISNVKMDYSLGSRSWFTVDGDMDLNVSISVDVMKLTGNNDAVHLVLGSINLGVGKIECSVDINLKGQVSYSSTMEFRVGLEYSDGFRPITNINKKSYTISAEAELSAMLATSLNVNLGVLKCNGWFKVGPIMSFNLKQHSDGTPRQCVTIGGYLYAGAYLGGSYSFLGLKDSCSKSIEIFTSRNSPIRTSQHWEDNVEVTSCTRGADTGVKYVSPANTRYASSGQRDYTSGSGGSGSGGVTSTWQYTTDSNTGEATITKYTGTVSAVTIPEVIDGHTVTKIGDRAFYENSTLRSVIIPDTILNIGTYAFYRCGNLKTVSFGESIQKIDNYAFRETGIAYARLPEGLVELGSGVFYNCPSLTGAYIPSTLKKAIAYSNTSGGYDYGAFAMCPNFDDVTFGDGITIIPKDLFCACTSLTHVEIPETVTSIDEYAFEDCIKLTEVTIPEYVTTIMDGAFRGCKQLKTVNFNTYLTKIDNYAFRETGIAYARLPEGLVELGSGVFYNCPSLTGAYIPSTLKKAIAYSNTSGGYDYGAFAMCPNFDDVTFGDGITIIPKDLFCACTSLTHVEIPETVTIIDEYAFEDCIKLTEVTIPEYVTTIMDGAFRGCKQLKTVNFNTYLTKIANNAFSETGITYARLPEGLVELGSGVFYNCPSLTGAYIPSTLKKAIAYSNTSGGYDYGAFAMCPNFDDVTFGDGITIIPKDLFCACTSLTHIEIPETVTSIGEYAFEDCIKLTDVTIPEKMTTIMDGAFRGCTQMKSVTVKGKITTITISTFSGCKSLTDVTLPDGVTSISTSAFEGCAALKDISWLPYTVTTIGGSAFEGCTGLIDATIPDYVTSLGSEAFKNCTKLQTVTTGAGLLTMGYYCFQGCKELSELRLNEGLTEIATYAFQGCEALTDVVIPDTVTKMGTYCFQGNKALKSVKLSKSLTEIPQYAFANCVKLPEIVIPKGVKTIGANAFYQDTMLKTVEIPQTVTSIGSNAFSYASSTTVRGVEGSYAQTALSWGEFINIGNPAQSVTFAGGETELVIGKAQTVTPAFEVGPVDSTDVVTDMKSDSTNVTVDTKNMTLYGYKAGSANITATTSSGKTFTLKVTVTGKLVGIEIARLPDKVSYKLGEEKDISGLEVYAVYDDGSRQRVYDYTVSHFTTDTIGTRAVTVTYTNQNTTFPVTVIDEEGNGSLGNNQELKWHIDQGANIVDVQGTVEKNDKVIAVTYDENGRMISAHALNVGGDGVTIDSEYDQLNIMWLDEASNPKCANSVITPAA